MAGEEVVAWSLGVVWGKAAGGRARPLPSQAPGVCGEQQSRTGRLGARGTHGCWSILGGLCPLLRAPTFSGCAAPGFAVVSQSRQARKSCPAFLTPSGSVEPALGCCFF